VALGVILLVVLASAGLLVVRGFSLTPTSIRTMLTMLGVWGPLVLIVGLAAVLVVPIIPASLFQIGAGLAFGPYVGLIAVCVADILGASLGFWIARWWGDTLLRRWLAPATHTRLRQLAARMSWRMVMLLRLLPGPAYPLVSFAAGAAPISFVAYIVGSFLGVLPALVLLVVAGDLALRSPLLAFVVVVGLVGGLALAGSLIGSGKRGNANADPQSEDLESVPEKPHYQDE
jgi:uncharacterized membrane protein YdjX (TVP38/TMEM64 family)